MTVICNVFCFIATSCKDLSGPGFGLSRTDRIVSGPEHVFHLYFLNKLAFETALLSSSDACSIGVAGDLPN